MVLTFENPSHSPCVPPRSQRCTSDETRLVLVVGIQRHRRLELFSLTVKDLMSLDSRRREDLERLSHIGG